MRIQSDINKIVIHCTDSPDSSSYDIANIEIDHMARGFEPSSDGRHIGYHYVVDRHGVIHITRPENEVGVHVAGHNSGTIAVCWIGRESMTINQSCNAEPACQPVLRQTTRRGQRHTRPTGLHRRLTAT